MLKIILFYLTIQYNESDYIIIRSDTMLTTLLPFLMMTALFIGIVYFKRFLVRKI